MNEPTVVLLGPDAAMQTHIAKMGRHFKGEPFEGSAFVTSVLVKRDGKWLERFYQVTHLAP